MLFLPRARVSRAPWGGTDARVILDAELKTLSPKGAAHHRAHEAPAIFWIFRWSMDTFPGRLSSFSSCVHPVELVYG